MTQELNPVKKKKKRDVVYIASDDSFPCSDPPGWIKIHTGCAEDEEEE